MSRVAVLSIFCLVISAPAQVPPEVARAQAFENQGNYADAAKAWRKFIKQHPNDAGAFASLGVDLSRLSDFKNAAVAYRKALSIDPKLPGIPLNLGLAEFKQGQFQQALAPLQIALASSPENTQVQLLLGMSNYGAGHYKEAIRLLDPVVASSPDSSELRLVLAQSCLWADQYPQALEHFKALLTRDPNSAEVHILTAQALDGMNRQEEAKAELETAVKQAPNQPGVHFLLGYIYWRQRDFDVAAKHFQQELAQDSKHPQANAYMADVLIHRNDYRGAEPLLKTALAGDPMLRLAHLDLGIVYEQANAPAKAIAAYKQATRLDKTRPDAHYRLAKLYRSSAQQKEADAEFAIVKQMQQATTADALRKVSGKPPALAQ